MNRKNHSDRKEEQHGQKADTELEKGKELHGRNTSVSLWVSHPDDSQTYRISIQPRRFQHLLVRDPIQDWNPPKECIWQLRQSRSSTPFLSSCSI